MQKKFELRRTGDLTSFDSDMKEILQDIPHNKDGLMKLRSQSLISENDLKDILTDSFFYRLKKRMSNSNHLYQKFFIKMSLFRISAAIVALWGTLSDYVLDSQLTFSFLVSWNTVKSQDFPLGDVFLDISIFLTTIFVLSHILSTIVLVHRRRFEMTKLKCKLLYSLSILCYPAFYVMSFVLFEAKSLHSPPANIEDFIDEEIIRFQFSQSINEQKIVEFCVENIPQLILLVLFSMSVPLYGKVKPFLGIVFFGFKAGLQYFSFSLQVVKFNNFQRQGKIEALGKILLALSSLFFVISRIACIIFCITFSSFFPDLPYFCYHTAKILDTDTNAFSKIEDLPPVLTPRVLNAFGAISISAKPFYSCVAVLILSNIVYFLSMNQIFLVCKERPSVTSQFLSCLVNSYCPVKQPMRFQHRDGKMNLYYNRRAFTVALLIYTFTTALLVLVPFLCYGSDLFLTSLTVLDELIRCKNNKKISFGRADFRFNRILFLTQELPGEFPDRLPATLLHAHIIFPAVAGVQLQSNHFQFRCNSISSHLAWSVNDWI